MVPILMCEIADMHQKEIQKEAVMMRMAKLAETGKSVRPGVDKWLVILRSFLRERLVLRN